MKLSGELRDFEKYIRTRNIETNISPRHNPRGRVIYQYFVEFFISVLGVICMRVKIIIDSGKLS